MHVIENLLLPADGLLFNSYTEAFMSFTSTMSVQKLVYSNIYTIYTNVTPTSHYRYAYVVLLYLDFYLLHLVDTLLQSSFYLSYLLLFILFIQLSS